MKKTLELTDVELNGLLTLMAQYPNPDKVRIAKGLTVADMKTKLERLKRKQPIKSSSRKAKGRELQKWVCEQVSTLTGIPYDQKDDESLIRSREMGQSGTDVVLRGEAAKRFPFAVECKNHEQISLAAFVRQARANTPEGRKMLLVLKNKALLKPVVVLEWETFAFLCGSNIDW